MADIDDANSYDYSALGLPSRTHHQTARDRSSAIWQSQSGLGRAAGIASVAEAVYGGYQAGQTTGAGDDIQGLIGATAAGAAVGGPVGAAVAAGAYIVANIFGIARGRDARAKIRAQRTRRIIDVDATEAVALPYLRGRFRRDLLLVYAAVGDDMPGYASGTTAFRNIDGRPRVFGRMRTKYRAAGSNTFEYDADDQDTLFFGPGRTDNEAYLLAQYDVCAGAITELYSVTNRGRDIHADSQLRDQVLVRLGLPNTVDAALLVDAATGSFVPSGGPGDIVPPRRTANTRFLNKSYATAWFWAAKRDYEAWGTDGNVPPLSALGYGPSLKQIVRTGTAPNYVYAESTTVDYNSGRNPVLVEYDRLRNIVGIPVDQFHLPAWYKAQEQARLPVGSFVEQVRASSTQRHRSPRVVGGRIEEVADVLENSFLSGLGFIVPGSTDIGTGLQSTGIFGSTASAETVLRYEYDGEVPSDIPSKEQGALILSSMPGAIVFRTHDGKLSISLPDADTPADTQSVGVIDDARILFYDYPRADDVVSQMSVKFRDVNQDLRETTQTYPTPGSQLATDLETLEGEPQALEFDLPGVVNPYLAHSAAVNYVLQSHRKIGRIACPIRYWPYDVGDIADFKDEEEGIDDKVRILQRQVVGFTVLLDIMEFHTIDSSWQPKQVEVSGLPSTLSLSIPVPVSLAVSIADGLLTFTWNTDSIRNVGGYESEVDYGNGQWVPLASTNDATVRYATLPLVQGTRTYKLRVRCKGIVSGFSDWSEIESDEISTGLPVITEPLAEGSICPPPGRGQHGQWWYSADPVTGEVRIFRHLDIFAEIPDQSEMTPEGINGALWVAEGITMRGSATTDYQWYRTTDDLTGMALLNPDLAEAEGTTAFNADQIVYWPETSTTRVDNRRRVSFRTAINGVFKSGDDLKPEIEEVMFLAFEFADGRRTYMTFDDADEPYASLPVVFTQLFDEQFVGSAVGPMKVCLGRLDKRCEGDPTNPWMPVSALGIAGLDGLGLELIYSTAATNASIPAGELPPTTLPYNNALNEAGEDVGVRIVAGAVSTATSGGRVWYDTEQSTTEAEPWLVVLARSVAGQPENGAVPTEEWTPWSNPVFRKTYAADGTTFELETIWGAFTENTLAENQMPLDEWTLEQIEEGSPITRNGVIWAKTLEASGFGLDKEYGFKADRQFDSNQAAGSVVAESWNVTLDAHWGIPGEDGGSSRFIYSDIGSIARAGGYQFFEGGTSTAASGDNVGGDWRRIKEADWLEVGRNDRHGWPCLEWDDLTSDDYVLYTPSSSQWVSYSIRTRVVSGEVLPEIHSIEGGWRIGIAKLRVSDGSGANVSVSGGVPARFWLSVERRPMPPNLQGVAIYNGSRRAGTGPGPGQYDWDESEYGYFGFFNSKNLSTPVESTSDTVVLEQFSAVVKEAVLLRINLRDEHNNEFDSLEDLVSDRHHIAMLLIDSSHLDRLDSWAAWRVTGVDLDLNANLTALDIELVSYRANRSMTLQRFPSLADVQFMATPPRDIAPALTVRIVSAAPIAAGGTNTSSPIEAVIGGSAAAVGSTARLTARLSLNVIQPDGSGEVFTSTSSGDYSISAATIQGRKVTGTIGFPLGVAETARLMVEVTVIATYPDQVIRARDNEVITQDASAGIHLPQPDAPELETSGGTFFIPQPTPQVGQRQWEYQWGLTNNVDDYAGNAGRTAPSGPGVTISDDSFDAGDSVYARVRYIGDGQSYYTSRWSPFGTIVVSNTVRLPEITLSVPETQPAALTSGYIHRSDLDANATGWQYEFDTNRDFSSPTRRTGSSTTASQQLVTGLTRDASYWFRARQITTRTGYANSNWSAPVNLVNTRGILPFSLDASRTTISGGFGSITFTPARHDPQATRWELAFGEDADVWKADQIEQATPQTGNLLNTVPITKSNLIVGRRYYWSARSRRAGSTGDSSWTNRGYRLISTQLPQPTASVAAGVGSITISANIDANAIGWYYVYSNREGTGRSGEGFLGIEDATANANRLNWIRAPSGATSVTVEVPTTDTYYAAVKAIGGLGYTESEWSETASSQVTRQLSQLRTPTFTVDDGNALVLIDRTSAMPVDAQIWEVRWRVRNRVFDATGNVTSTTYLPYTTHSGINRNLDEYSVTGLTNFAVLADNTAGTQSDYGFSVRLRAYRGRARDSDWATEQYARPAATARTRQPVATPNFRLTAGDKRIVVTLTDSPTLDSNATNWAVRWGEGNLSGDGITQPTTASTYTITGLTNGTTYNVSIKAVSTTVGYTDSPWATIKTARPEGRGKLNDLDFTLTAGDGQFEVARGTLDSRANRDWQYRWSTSQSGVQRASARSVPLGTTTRTISGRDNGTTIYVQVRQRTTTANIDDSDWSDAKPVTPGAGTTALTAPTLSVSPGDASATASITSGIPTGATSWSLRYGTDNPPDSATAGNRRLITGLALTTSGLSRLVSSLTNGTAYHFQAMLVSDNTQPNFTDSPWSIVASATPTAVRQLPRLTVTLTPGNRQVIVAVNPLDPAARGGWQFQWSTDSTFATGVTTVRGDSDRRNTVANLTNGTTYFFRARQLRGNNLAVTDSEWSIVRNTSPGQPMDVLAFRLEGRNNSVAVTRAALHSAANGWEYRWSRTSAGVSSATPTFVARSAGATAIIRNITNGTTIYVQVRQRTSTAGWADSPWSVTRSEASSGAIKLPLLTMTLTPGNGRVIVGRSALHAQATNWQYRFATTEAGLATARNINGGSGHSSRPVTGLVNGTTYWFQIRQITNRSGYRSGDWTDADSETPQMLTAKITNYPLFLSDGESSQLDIETEPTIAGAATNSWRTTSPLTLSSSSSSRGSARTSRIARPYIHAPARVSSDSDETIDLSVTRGGIEADAPQIEVPTLTKRLEIGIVPPTRQAFRFPGGTTQGDIRLLARMNKTFKGPVTYTWTKTAGSVFTRGGNIRVPLTGINLESRNVSVTVTAKAGGLTATNTVHWQVGNGNYYVSPSNPGGLIDIASANGSLLGDALATSSAIASVESRVDAIRAAIAEVERIAKQEEEAITDPDVEPPDADELLMNWMDFDRTYRADQSLTSIIEDASAARRQSFINSVGQSAGEVSEIDTSGSLTRQEQQRFETLQSQAELGTLSVSSAFELLFLTLKVTSEYETWIVPPAG